MTTVAEPTTRERLLAAAIEVFRRDGYERARVGDIARAAGLTTGAIYAQFRGKAELLVEAMAARSAQEVDGLVRELQGADARERLARLGARLLRPAAPEERPLLLDAVVASQRDPELAARLHDRLAAREAAVADLLAGGAVDPALDLDAVARLCVMLALGALVVRTLDLDHPDPAAWDDVIARLLDAVAPTRPHRADAPETP